MGLNLEPSSSHLHQEVNFHTSNHCELDTARLGRNQQRNSMVSSDKQIQNSCYVLRFKIVGFC